MTNKGNNKNNTERNEDMSKVYSEKTYISKDTKEYDRKQRDELIKNIAKKRNNVLKKLSKT